MSKMTAKFVKQSALRGTTPKKVAASAVAGFNLVEGTGDDVTVGFVDSAGNPVTPASLPTLTDSSDTPTVITVAEPNGLTFHETAVGPVGSANITVVATWADGSVGPFTITYPDTVTAGPAGGLVINHGTPTVN